MVPSNLRAIYFNYEEKKTTHIHDTGFSSLFKSLWTFVRTHKLKVVYFMMKTCTYFKYVNVYLYEMNNFSL